MRLTFARGGMVRRIQCASAPLTSRPPAYAALSPLFLSPSPPFSLSPFLPLAPLPLSKASNRLTVRRCPARC